MSPFFAIAMPTVVVILTFNRAEAPSGPGCLCESQNQTQTDTRTTDNIPPVQRISLRIHRDFGAVGCAFSNMRCASPELLARSETASSLLFLVPSFRVSAKKTYETLAGFKLFPPCIQEGRS